MMDLNYFYDLADRALATEAPVFSNFIDLAGLISIRQRLKVPSGLIMLEYTGFKSDERRMIGFFPGAYLEFMNESDLRSMFPVKMLCIARRFPEDKVPGHRDLLGSLLGMSLDRKLFGDIVIYNNEAYILCHERVHNLILNELSYIGKTAVDIQICETDTSQLEPASIDLKFTVPSMRLDNIVKGLSNLSRTDANRFIQTGLIKVNQVEVYKNHVEVKAFDIISIRHKGKYQIIRIGDKTKKGRMYVEAIKYT